jgi:hypothetical protein
MKLIKKKAHKVIDKHERKFTLAVAWLILVMFAYTMVQWVSG